LHISLRGELICLDLFHPKIKYTQSATVLLVVEIDDNRGNDLNRV